MSVDRWLITDNELSFLIGHMKKGDCIFLFPMDDGTIQLTFKKLTYGINEVICPDKEIPHLRDMYSKPVYTDHKMTDLFTLLNSGDNEPLFDISRDTYMFMAFKLK